MGGPPLGYPRDASTAARLARAVVDPGADAGSAACCRICLEVEGELVTPCQCKGSVAHVHGSCLERWRLMNFSANKADVFAGWKDMDLYMRENKIEGTPSVLTQLAPEPVKPTRKSRTGRDDDDGSRS